MTRQEIAEAYAKTELQDNHAPIEVIVAAAFLNGIDYEQHHPRWISVEDELPPKKTGEASDKVLVYEPKTNRIGASWYFHSTGKWFNGWDVTHWMPLPEPPEHFADVSKKKGGKQ